MMLQIFLVSRFGMCTYDWDSFMLQMSWIGSIMPLAALFGGMAGGPLIESLGRRTTIISTAVPFIVCKYIIRKLYIVKI